MGFGQHQSFYLRPQWIHKGMVEVDKNPRFFYEENHFEILGIGKNMAKSVRYWMIATNVIKDVRNKKIEQYPTEIGYLVEGYDPYLQKVFTKGLLHYYLVTDENIATTWYWFFNIYKEEVFDKNNVLESLEEWVNSNIEKAISPNSLRRDVDCLFQTYSMKKFNNGTPEDVIRSPFEELNLISQTIQNTYTKVPLIGEIHYELLYITLILHMDKHQKVEIDINDLNNSVELWGKVFNLSRSVIVDIVEEMQKDYPIVFTRTNRLDIVRLAEKINIDEEIKKIYEKEVLR